MLKHLLGYLSMLVVLCGQILKHLLSLSMLVVLWSNTEAFAWLLVHVGGLMVMICYIYICEMSNLTLMVANKHDICPTKIQRGLFFNGTSQ